MALIVEDCVVETSTTTGTGALALAGAVVGFQSFSDVCSVGELVFYLIEGIDGSGDRTGEWETGLGTYSAADELTRTTVHTSSNAGATVSLSAGTKRVSLSLTSTQAKFRGALAKKAADETTANYTTATAVTWDSETGGYDTSGFHDTGAATSRMTILAGVNYVRLSTCINLSSVTADVFINVTIRKGGSGSYVGVAAITVEAGTTTPMITLASPVLAVAEAEYFEVYLTIETDTSVTVTAATSWFALEVVE